MPFPLKRGHCQAMCGLLCLSANLVFFSAAHAQTTGSTPRGARVRYLAFTFFTGTQFQFFHPGGGVVNVSFPYYVTDHAGVTQNFSFDGQKAGIYVPESSYILPMGLEMGWRRHFFNFSTTTRVVQGRLLVPAQVEAGWGYLWFFDPPRRAADFRQKRWVIKTSLNVNYTADKENGKRAVLGSIDNADQTIHLLGLDAEPTFTKKSRYSTTTYYADHLDVCYSQRELALLPKIGIANNPYHRYLRWELDVGYNLPLIDRPGLLLNQIATDGTQLGISDAVPIHQRGIVASYNGKPIGPAPFRFQGLFLQLVLNYGYHSQ